jgi:UDP-N-acetylglucosamine 2-epimerase (non-hydrolysing)
MQKEAYMLGVPCITLRENTEWVETLHNGWNVLTGTESSKIHARINTDKPAIKQRDIFGHGASVRIREILDDQHF